jgi:hypothetical protein
LWRLGFSSYVNIALMTMSNIVTKVVVVLLAIIILPATAVAHQPKISEQNEVTVNDPEISKSYYSELDNGPDNYTLYSNQKFNLYVNLLVPDIAGQSTDISAKILKDGSPIGELNGQDFDWQSFYEPFGADSYLMGPEFDKQVEPGNYRIEVSSNQQNIKYSLAVGKIESFGLVDSWQAISTIPQLKRDFFGKSPASFIFSPLAIVYILVMFLLSFAFGLAYRKIIRKVAKTKVKKVKRNIGQKDRLLRISISVLAFVLAITTSWSPILLFVSGFALFEAISGWCAFYSAVGKNTCPID